MKKVAVYELEIGMYVEELDRPWLETPYLLQGVRVESQEDIDELAKHCKFVYVTSEDNFLPEKLASQAYTTHIIPEDSGQKTQFHGHEDYPIVFSFEEEMPAARKAHDKAEELIMQIKLDIDRELKLDFDIAKELVNVIAGSILNNPSAMLFLNQLKSSNSGHYEHALNTAIHMIAFGRHLCLPTDEIYILGLGGLLMDIGKLQEADLAGGQDNLYQINFDSTHEHVLRGRDILSNIPAIPEPVIQIALQHHEREDGSGYPYGLAGNQITTYARMAAIVDIYERLISEGLSALIPPASPFAALKILWDLTRTGLNATLVQQFAHCIGLFPVGSLVELNTGEVAIVITQSRANRLLPTVMVVLDENKKPRDLPLTIDLATNKTNSNGGVYEIIMDLKPGAYGIDPDEYYL